MNRIGRDLEEAVRMSGIFSGRPDGAVQREFVPFNEHLSVKYLAGELDAGRTTVDELFTGLWSVPEEKDLWGHPDMRSEGPYALLPAWKPLIRELADLVADPDDFVLNLNQRDPHMAARCVGSSGRRLKDATIEAVVRRLERRLSLRGSYEGYRAVESLGETGSLYACGVLERLLGSKDWVCRSIISSEAETMLDRSLSKIRWSGCTFPPQVEVIGEVTKRSSSPEYFRVALRVDGIIQPVEFRHHLTTLKTGKLVEVGSSAHRSVPCPDFVQTGVFMLETETDCFRVEVGRADLGKLYRILTECYAEKVIDSAPGSKGMFELYGPRTHFGLLDKIRSEHWIRGAAHVYDGGHSGEYPLMSVTDGLSKISGGDCLGALMIGHAGSLDDLPALKEAMGREISGMKNTMASWIATRVLRFTEYDSLCALAVEWAGLLFGHHAKIDVQWWRQEYDNWSRANRIADLKDAIAIVSEKCRPSRY